MSDLDQVGRTLAVNVACIEIAHRDSSRISELSPQILHNCSPRGTVCSPGQGLQDVPLAASPVPLLMAFLPTPHSLPTTTLVPWAGERCLCPQENHAGGGTRVAQWWGRPPPGYTKPSLGVLRALGDSWEVALGLSMCNPSFPLKQKAMLSAFVHARKLNM